MVSAAAAQQSTMGTSTAVYLVSEHDIKCLVRIHRLPLFGVSALHVLETLVEYPERPRAPPSGSDLKLLTKTSNR